VSSQDQIIKYAEHLLESKYKEAVMERIIARSLQGFRRATIEERNKISDVLDSMESFFNELELIATENEPVNDTEEEILPLTRED